MALFKIRVDFGRVGNKEGNVSVKSSLNSALIRTRFAENTQTESEYHPYSDWICC
jgi:hypothetical protein